MKSAVSLCVTLTAAVGVLHAAVSAAASTASSTALSASALLAASVNAASVPGAPDAATGTNANANAGTAANKTPARGSTTSHLPFAALGAYQPLNLRGLDDMRTVNVGVRLDRVATAAHLLLRYTYSPALVFPISHLKVSINNEVVATVPFDRDYAGQMVTQDIPLDPRFLTDYNQIGLRLIAHYTLDHCEYPENSALWADVSPTSEIVLDTAPIRLPNDLALLPAPFFDRRDVNRLRLPFVLPAAADNATLRSAGVLASWFGAQADYRQARFPALTALPSDDQAVVVARSAQLPAELKLPPVNGPMLIVTDNPDAPNRKLLIVTGRTGRGSRSGERRAGARQDRDGGTGRAHRATRHRRAAQALRCAALAAGEPVGRVQGTDRQPEPVAGAGQRARRDPPEPARARRPVLVERRGRAAESEVPLYRADRAEQFGTGRADQRSTGQVVPPRARQRRRRAGPSAIAGAVEQRQPLEQHARHSGVPRRQFEPAAVTL